MNHTTNQPLATAPEVPSSMNYYDPRSYNHYMPPNNTTTTNSPHFNSPSTQTNTTYAQPLSTHSTQYPSNNYLINHSLPPLSHLLPTTSKNNQQPSTAAAVRKNSTMDVYPQAPQNYYYSMQPPPPSSVPSQSDLSFHPPLPPNTMYTARGQLYHLPSPPTSVIDGVFITDPNPYAYPYVVPPANQKVFSFVPLPGLNQKKRPRRKFHEVERLYQCSFPGCTKAYGTLNHLNAHVSMQRHGPKRQPSEFKELRKMWRKQKRERKQRQSKEDDETMNDILTTQPYPMYHPTPWNNRYLQSEFMPPPPPPPPPY